MRDRLLRLTFSFQQFLDGGRPVQALELATQALELARSRLGEQPAVYARLLSDTAVIHGIMGNSHLGIPLLTNALAIQQQTRGDKDRICAISKDNLAQLYSNIGDIATAQRLYAEAQQVLQEYKDDYPLDYATSLHNQALLHQKAGRLRDAAALHREAAALFRTTLGKNDPSYATALNCLAVLYWSIGHLNGALVLQQEVLRIRRQCLGMRHPDYCTALNNLAVVLRDLDRFPEAIRVHLRCAELLAESLGKMHSQYAMNLDNLAVAYALGGDLAAAERACCSAQDAWRAAGAEDSTEYAASLDTLAMVSFLLGNNEAAERLYNRALQLKATVLGPDHPACAATLDELAALYASTGRLEEALAMLLRTISLQDLTIPQVFSIGAEGLRLGHMEKITSTFHALLSLLISNFLSRPAVAIEALDVVLRRKAIAADAHALQLSAPTVGAKSRRALQLQELSTLRMQIARTVFDGWRTRGEGRKQELLRQWVSRKEALEAKLATEIPEVQLVARLLSVDHRSIAEALPAGAALIEFIRFPVLGFPAGPQQGSPRWGPARYAAFVLHAGDPDSVVALDLGEAHPIETLTRSFRVALSRESALRAVATSQHGGPAILEDVVATGTALRRAIFDPLREAVVPSTRLYIAPDGALSTIPFEALPLGPDAYLLDGFVISYLTVGRDVLSFGHHTGASSLDPLVAGDPDFDLHSPMHPPPPNIPRRRSREDGPETDPILSAGEPDFDRPNFPVLGHVAFERLPGTRAEAEAIAAMLGVRPLLGPEVLESRVKACRSPLIIHLATHGAFLPVPPTSVPARHPIQESRSWLSVLNHPASSQAPFDSPFLRSFVALAGANTWLKGQPLPDDAEDGILTGEDALALKLRGTQLVVLSACDTGRGDIYAGEGVFGLRRAFLLAGARTLISSLWKVPDNETTQLMVSFYDGLLTHNRSRATALRDAQFVVRSQQPHPYYWASFVCVGDPGPLPRSETRSRGTPGGDSA